MHFQSAIVAALLFAVSASAAVVPIQPNQPPAAPVDEEPVSAPVSTPVPAPVPAPVPTKVSDYKLCYDFFYTVYFKTWCDSNGTVSADANQLPTDIDADCFTAWVDARNDANEQAADQCR